MKNLKFVLGVLLSLVMFSACSNDDESEEIAEDDENVIQPIDVADNPIDAFFNSQWPEPHTRLGGSGESPAFFHTPGPNGGSHLCEDTVCVINSRQELTDVYLGKKELPEIDFDRYTLIFGQHVMGGRGFYVTKKELVRGEDGNLTLNLHARNDDYLIMCACQIICFWGLYPKLTQKNVFVNVIEEYTNL